MFEPLAYYILPNCLMSNIKGGCFILKHNQRGSFSSLIASQARLGKFATNLFQPDELQFRDRDGRWLERNGWGSPWLSASLKEAFWVVRGEHLRERKKENAVSFNCAKPAWKTSAWITATVYHMGILAVRHKFRHTNRNTCALCIWIPSQGRERGFQNLFICRFPLVRLMKNSKYMDNKRVCFFFFYLQTSMMEVHESFLLLAATNAAFVSCSPNIRCIWLRGFSGSTLKGSYLKSLIPAWLFCKEGHAGRWFCEYWPWW